MKSFGIRQAKAHLSAIVRAAAGGERTLITDYGQPVAVIAPPLEDPQQVEAPAEPVKETKPLSDAAAFRHALLSAPHPLELDF
jgi:prevent-host-death family protein